MEQVGGFEGLEEELGREGAEEEPAAIAALVETVVRHAAAATTAGLAVHRDDPTLSHAELNVIDAVATTTAVGMADSGTIATSRVSTLLARAWRRMLRPMPVSGSMVT